MADDEHGEDSAPYYCIIEARCRLCQFALKDNELVYAAVGDDRVSEEFEFQQQLSVYDEDLDINFHLCLGDECLSRTKATVCFHSRCYEFRSYPITPTFLAATKYAFVVPAHEERRRADYIQRALAQNLSLATSWPRELPHKLWLMIARPMVQECAVLNLEEAVHRSDAISNSMLDLSRPVYATYVKVEARYYVRSLQNSLGTDASKQAHLLLPARTEKQGTDDDDAGKDLFVVEDHIGILQVIFVSPNRRDQWCRSQPSIPGAWWRHIPRETTPSTAAIKTNKGLVVRDIQSTLQKPAAGVARISWQVPVPFPPP
ncbi:hypothetical protein QQX98_001128 [Neonectria punicea]|uniref:Uncharacterized protein n=1 Tax=Neonectria punicea TaxID=979145 RepID=A0ABR1HQR4_9HYPO